MNQEVELEGVRRFLSSTGISARQRGKEKYHKPNKPTPSLQLPQSFRSSRASLRLCPLQPSKSSPGPVPCPNLLQIRPCPIGGLPRTLEHQKEEYTGRIQKEWYV